jgi:hypothetical protein
LQGIRCTSCRSHIDNKLGSAIEAVPYNSRVSACRRELNTSSAAQPRAAELHEQRCTSDKTVESETKFGSSLSVGSTNLERQRVQGLVAKKHEDWSPPCSIAAPSCVGSRTGVPSPTAAKKASPRQPAGQLQGSAGSALPNPSLKLSPNGVPPGPRGRAVYHRPRGPGVTPSVPT